MDNWWTPAPLIVARIRALLPDDWEVQQVASMEVILLLAEFDRVVYVAPLGSPSTQSAGQGKVADIAQKYAVVFAVRSQGDESGEDRRSIAGPVISGVIPRLMAYSIGRGWAPLEITSAPAADYIAAEFAYYPFAFETSTQLRAIQ